MFDADRLIWFDGDGARFSTGRVPLVPVSSPAPVSQPRLERDRRTDEELIGLALANAIYTAVNGVR
jgi:hypothetical protein